MAHIGLIKELRSASDLLESAIDRYTNACAAIFNCFEPGGSTAQDLLDSVVAEFPKALNYEAKLQQAMAFTYRVRNQSPSFVPINILPPEVVSRIFWFSERCCLPKSRWARRDTQANSHIIYPEAALELHSQVCSLMVRIPTYWTSRAYTGLIELDLEFSHKCDINITITEFELANILRASPGLRVLRFSLEVTSGSEDSAPTPEPVHLNHLEIVRLDGKYPGAQEAVLRVIYPGQAPLQMTTEVTEHFSWSSPYWVQFINFISRSKITQLQLQGAAPRPFKIFLEISEIFPLLSQLQVLTLSGLILGRACEEILGDYDATSFLSLLHNYTNNIRGQNLQLVRLASCRIYWSDFRHTPDMHPMEILILDRCEVIKTRPQKRRFGQRWDWTDKLMDAAMKICPSARVELNCTRGEFEELSEFEVGDWPKKKGRGSNGLE
ncbi:unnamed protein product [Rhizoctonia solani]|uniref:Uncharacterized protein n=1 Tax=Rhizoctonia solani TaxID=456999 RepID=A0A8H3CAF9_9AGAM|nr:unnamed protein product [Rhizoctonia solani]